MGGPFHVSIYGKGANGFEGNIPQLAFAKLPFCTDMCICIPEVLVYVGMAREHLPLGEE